MSGTLIIWLSNILIEPSIVPPSNFRYPPNGLNGLGTAEPSAVNPKRLFTYPTTALCVGAASVALSTIAVSVKNAVIATPRLNPIPSKLLSAILALNVTRPVPWSTVKNLPTRKKPSWSVLT